MRARAFAPINLAVIKYWGKENVDLRIPANSSLSVCLSKMGTETEVEFKKDLKEDEVEIDGKKVKDKERDRVVKQLDRVRKMAKLKLKAKVVSKNNFPKSAGLSSSASGLAALSLAASKAAGLDLNERDLSRLARVGSGSACRSIPDGWVEWFKGKDDKTSYARQVFKEDYWDLRVLGVILSKKEKKVVTTDGHLAAKTSRFYKQRIEAVERDLELIKQYIKKREFKKFGELMEDECLNMHAVMLTSKPNLIYWLPETVRVMRSVQDWREEGLGSYFSINTGQNVFVISEPENEAELVKRLSKVKGVIEVRRERIGKGARLLA